MIYQIYCPDWPYEGLLETSYSTESFLDFLRHLIKYIRVYPYIEVKIRRKVKIAQKAEEPPSGKKLAIG